MEDRRNGSRRLLRWSLAGLFAASLWLGAYFGGRHAGFDNGHAEGFDSALKDGLATGRVEGIRQNVERYKKKGVYEEVYEVGDLLRERQPPNLEAATPNGKPIFDFDALIHEIVTNVSPGTWPEFGGTGGKSIRGFPTNLTLVISAEAVDHAEIALFLESKDDYLAWKRSQQKP